MFLGKTILHLGVCIDKKWHFEHIVFGFERKTDPLGPIFAKTNKKRAYL